MSCWLTGCAAGIGFRDLGEHRLKDLGRAERVFQVTGPGLAEGFGSLRSLDDPALRHNLPWQVDQFRGPGGELTELRSQLRAGSRLVTIVGPGGIGKSRLALQVAAEELDGTGDGVWLVDLAPVADPGMVSSTAATAMLGLREEPGRPTEETLLDGLSARRLLLVLDNCEQVLGAVAKLVEDLLRRCPGVVVLVTSREPLRLAGEHVYRVPSLAVPPGGPPRPPGDLLAADAVQLFAERGSQVRADFAVDGSNAEAVASICRRLDGIPLAIELAAARLSAMSPLDVDRRLDQRFQLLTGGSRTALPRHQTLRAMIDWSYDLLNPGEQLVLDRLSVFAGGWTLAAAEAVTAAGDRGMAGAGPSGCPGGQEPGPGRRDPRFDALPAAGDGPAVRRRTPRPAGRLRAG